MEREMTSTILINPWSCDGALVPIRPKQSDSSDAGCCARPTPIDAQYRHLSDLSIPVEVLKRPFEERCVQYSQAEWDAKKSIIQKLYMEEGQSIESVIRTMAENFNFRATAKMYKSRFKRWGWRKYNHKDTNQTVVLASRRRGRPTASFPLRAQYITAPDLLKDQELPITISRRYTIDQSGSQRWTCTLLNMSESSSLSLSPTSLSSKPTVVVRFCDAEVEYVRTMHHLKNNRINAAFQSMNNLFDNMAGSTLYTHPKFLTGFWLICHGLQNACMWHQDSGFDLMREFICFHAANAAACFKASTSTSTASHPVVSLMRSVARMSRDNPAAMRHTFRSAYVAAANSLEEKLGGTHPIILVTWTDYYWYFNIPVDPAKNLAARHETALARAEAESGCEADVTICILHNLTFYLFYCAADDEYVRRALGDLLERTSFRIAEAEGSASLKSSSSARPNSFWIQRAYAFGSLLRGIMFLKDENDLPRCQEVVGAAIEWLKNCRVDDAPMHAAMLAFDLDMLTKAWRAGMDLRELTLSLAKPRSSNYNQK